MNHTSSCNLDNNNIGNNNNTKVYGNQKLFESESQESHITASRWDKH